MFTMEAEPVIVTLQIRESWTRRRYTLPPLKTHNFRHNYRNAEATSSKDEKDPEFYSPKLNGSESSIGTRSTSRRAFAAVEVGNFNGSTSNSLSTYSSLVTVSGSASPVRSMSLSVSPALSLSSRNSMFKSPDLIEIQMAPTLMQMTMALEPAPSSLVLRESMSSSPSSSSSPETMVSELAPSGGDRKFCSFTFVNWVLVGGLG
ncbi:unnamed protein product [Fraxinus pennsylvanica]|uniref:Uncharacterized protein n=1 Tax=Fraxinus pennsylvanica TaxID=56036 RepID=A0AAD2E8E0_9LAMI|nr:unnamed protein product [Fraxinus pennsylvanica]